VKSEDTRRRALDPKHASILLLQHFPVMHIKKEEGSGLGLTDSKIAVSCACQSSATAWIAGRDASGKMGDDFVQRCAAGDGD
jgi:hypothetical protein